MEVSKQCNHQPVAQDKRFSFCRNCGSLIYDKIPTIKPLKFNYSIEINPLLILDKMKNQILSINKDLTEKYINEISLDKRKDFIKYLNKLVHKLKFRSQTFYISCSYFDYILKINNEISIETAAIGSILLASKYDELDSVIPDICKYQSLGNKYYFSIEELKKSELQCLYTLNYKLNLFTAYHFINFFFSLGIVFEDDEIKNVSEKKEILKMKIAERVYDVTKEILLYFIEDEKSIEFNSIEIACSSITIAREKLKLKIGWDNRFEEVFQIQLESFKNCYDVMKSFYSRLNESRNKLRLSNKKFPNKDKEVNLKFPITSFSNDKKEIPMLLDENSESYRALSNQKTDSNRQLMPGEKIFFRSNDEIEILDKISDYKYLKSIGNDYIELRQMETINKQDCPKQLEYIENKHLRNNKYESEYVPKNQVIFSEDIYNSDLIQKTKNLLLNNKNGNKINKQHIDRPKSNIDDIDQNNNNKNLEIHKHKHNYNSNYRIKYQRQHDRNKSINILEVKSNNYNYDSQYNKVNNFEYQNRCRRPAYHYYKEKFESYSPEKVMKDFPYLNEENDYYNYKSDKILSKETIKNKIDREIYSRQRLNYANIKHINDHKEYNFIDNYQEELNDFFNKKNIKHYVNKRNGFYQQNMIHDKTSYLY